MADIWLTLRRQLRVLNMETADWYRRWVVREEVDTLLDDVYLVVVSHIVGRKLVHRDLCSHDVQMFIIIVVACGSSKILEYSLLGKRIMCRRLAAHTRVWVHFMYSSLHFR